MISMSRNNMNPARSAIMRGLFCALLTLLLQACGGGEFSTDTSKLETTLQSTETESLPTAEPSENGADGDSADSGSGGNADESAPNKIVLLIKDNSAQTTSTDVYLSIGASDDTGVTAYYVSENATAPGPNAPGWIALDGAKSVSEQVNYELSGETRFGEFEKTVYIWFKDAAGNVSESASDSILLVVNDVTAPRNLSVSIDNDRASTTSIDVTLSLSASDDQGVSAYFASENSQTPGLGDDGWKSVTVRSNLAIDVPFSLGAESSAGSYTKTVYVWFRDASGNLAGPVSDSITLTVLDTTPPRNPSIRINNGSNSTDSVSVTLQLSANDDQGVTAYYVSQSGSRPALNASGWTSVAATTSLSRSRNFTLSSGDGVKTVYAWFRDRAGNISSRASDSITLSSSTNSRLGSNWMFFGDSETNGRANEPSAKSQAIAFMNIWNQTFGENQNPYINGVGGRTLPGTYSKYRSTSGRGSASWIHFQESGYKFSDEDTEAEFIRAFENMVREIHQTTPNAIISVETAYSFEETSFYREWSGYNAAMRSKIAELQSQGITVYLAEVDRNIKELVSRKRAQLGTLDGQRTVWGDRNNSIGNHYTGLGNLMLALTIFDALGYDVNSLDMSLIPDSQVDAADKQLCLDIINSY